MNKPTEAQLKDHPEKQKLDAVLARGPEGKVFSIPTEVAEKYLVEDDHQEFDPQSAEAVGGEEVAEGRHNVWRANGTFGPHTDWLYGPYIWHVDGCVYNGLHYHPNPFSELAVDLDG